MGSKHPGDGSFASNCLMARRLAERGVRFIQLYHRAWDHHGDIARDMPVAARAVDRPCAALVNDLKQRGMLDDTLVIWGGEFGRTPMGQGSGRDHHINAFSIWLAGGGIKGGTHWGQTDELGYRYLDNDQKVHVHDLHATLLYLCGHRPLALQRELPGPRRPPHRRRAGPRRQRNHRLGVCPRIGRGERCSPRKGSGVDFAR